jgi:hypothetical protein
MHNSTVIDITDLSGNAFKQEGGLTTDELHPSKKVYQMWVEKIEYLIQL